ncbi:MAG TPA: ABC transporter substrate-binding protein [Pseudoclavibacter sp.]|nr:ABC transporter substrate-binding protein [Pseudoclavibacter sp.]
MKKTRIFAAIGLTMVLAVTGCAAEGDTSTAAKDDITIGLSAEPANLDFTTTDGAAIPQALLDNVYEGLVTLSDDGEIEPLLAESWEVSDDNRTYTFTLADGVTFSNGDPFTAETVKWNIERVQSDAWTISLKSYMDVVDTVEVVDDTHVAVTLTSPSNDWLFRMTTRIGAMFTPNAVDDLANTAVGTGPFTVDSFTPGDSLVLAARSDYWGQTPALSTVTLRYFDDSNALNNALLTGGIDAISGLPSFDSMSLFSDTAEFTTYSGSTNSEVVLSLNNASGIFTDARVRQAVSYAIDRETLIQNATGGTGTLIGSMVPPTDPWYDASLVDAYPYDPAKARELIEEAGVAGETIRFRIPNLENVQAAAQQVQSDLTAVGLTVEIETLEFPAVWLEDVFTGHDYDMSIVTHVEARDILTYANPDYYWGFDNAEFQDLVSRADEGTTEEQTQYMRQAAKLLSDLAVSDWLYLQAYVTITAAGVTGLPVNLLGESLNVTNVSWS